jgi:hypothetical protein
LQKVDSRNSQTFAASCTLSAGSDWDRSTGLTKPHGSAILPEFSIPLQLVHTFPAGQIGKIFLGCIPGFDIDVAPGSWTQPIGIKITAIRVDSLSNSPLQWGP